MRLIDADALIEVLAEHRDFNAPNLTPLANEAMTGGLRIAIREVKNSPTINIKTEVAREIFAEIEQILSVSSDGVATLDVRELYNIENKYTKEGVGE